MVMFLHIIVVSLLLVDNGPAIAQELLAEVPRSIGFYTRDKVLERHFKKIDFGSKFKDQDVITWQSPHQLDFLLRLNQKQAIIERNETKPDAKLLEELSKLCLCDWLVYLNGSDSKSFMIRRSSPGSLRTSTIDYKVSPLTAMDPIVWLQGELAYDATVVSINNRLVELQSWFPIGVGTQGLIYADSSIGDSVGLQQKAAALFRVIESDKRLSKAEIISRQTESSLIKPGSKIVFSKSLP